MLKSLEKADNLSPSLKYIIKTRSYNNSHYLQIFIYVNFFILLY